MNGRREASRWSGSPILPYGFGDRRMRVRTGMRSIPCAATPWSMVRVHDIAIACTRLGIISTPYHGSYHVRCLFEGVPVLVGCTLYTRPRPRCLFTGCLFTDRGSGNQVFLANRGYRSASGVCVAVATHCWRVSRTLGQRRPAPGERKWTIAKMINSDDVSME